MMYLWCAYGHFRLVVDHSPCMVIVRWPGLSGIISDIDHTSIHTCTSGTSVSHWQMSKQTSVYYRPISIPQGQGTPVDPRPDIGRYLNDVERMVGRWRWSIQTSENINSQLFLSYPLRSVTRESRPSHGDHMGVRYTGRQLVQNGHRRISSTSYT